MMNSLFDAPIQSAKPEKFSAENLQVSQNGYVAFDFETATSEHNSACSLGIVVAGPRGEIEFSEVFLIQPPCNGYSLVNVQIHGITPEMTKEAPSFREVWPKVREYFEGRIVVAHYAFFDVNVLAASLKAIGEENPACKVFCTCASARQDGRMKDLPNHRLNTISEFLQIPLNHHEALSDALACAKIFNYLSPPDYMSMTFDEAKDQEQYRRYFNGKVTGNGKRKESDLGGSLF